MARVIWTEPAVADVDSLAEYIALDNPSAARRFAERVFASVERLERFPLSGRRLPEATKSPYREIVALPCRL